jgi:CPA2 family monovalent cation:H+ antiporter-2
MPHDTPLIATIVVGLSLAFVFGAVAHRLKISPLVGYLLAGIAVSPQTPGFVADQALANELAEIGVILLMFGVGLHFSLDELWSVRKIAVPGALVQITVATLLGIALTSAMGWPLGAGIVFGLALSTASTVVLLRAVQERRLLTTERGHIAVGWLIVEDIAMVLTLVLLPTLVPLMGVGSPKETAGAAVGGADLTGVLLTVAYTVAKVAVFVALMIVVGRRFIPWVLHHIAHTGSRELFRLGVLAIALGFAFGAAKLFGVSFALGAFFAGMILSESELSQRAAEETLPLRDAFAVLFFVSVGMLFDPTILLRATWPVIGTIIIIVVGKSVAALAIVLAFRRPMGTALMISASLAQIGEFSFILAGLGVSLGVLPSQGRDLILAGALLSIVINPLLFIALDRLKPIIEMWDGKGERTVAAEPEEPELKPTTQVGHTVVVGYGRVGKRVVDGLMTGGVPLFIIDEREEAVKEMIAPNVVAVAGNAVNILYAANLKEAKCLLVAMPYDFEAGQIIAQAHSENPVLRIIARAHSEAEAQHLRDCGASHIILGEEKIAAAMIDSYWDTKSDDLV